MPKSLKTIVLKHLARLNSRQFVFLLFGIMAFVLALLQPEIRGQFLNIVEALCSKYPGNRQLGRLNRFGLSAGHQPGRSSIYRKESRGGEI